MKALTGLPTQAYAQVGGEANVPVADLLQLVQALESNLDPSFIARYRPDISCGLDASQIRVVHTRLREYGDLADRKIAVLASLTQQGRAAPELRAQVEATRTRRELEDLFAPFKQKPRTPADDAVDAGLEGLARFLWGQQPGDLLEEAAKYVSESKGVPDSDAALTGAREIVARWLAENGEVRSDLRGISNDLAEIVVDEVAVEHKLSAKDSAARQRYASLLGKTLKAANVPWKQLLNLRRGAREGWLRYGVRIPRDKCLEYLRRRLIQDPDAPAAGQLAAAAEQALDRYLGHSLEASVRQAVEERGDSEAIAAYEKNLRRTLLQPPAGRKIVIGLETSRPGGWRAAAVGPDGQLLEAAIVRSDPDKQTRQKVEDAAPPPSGAKAEVSSADAESSESTPEPPATASPVIADASMSAPPESAPAAAPQGSPEAGSDEPSPAELIEETEAPAPKGTPTAPSDTAPSPAMSSEPDGDDDAQTPPAAEETAPPEAAAESGSDAGSQEPAPLEAGEPTEAPTSEGIPAAPESQAADGAQSLDAAGGTAPAEVTAETASQQPVSDSSARPADDPAGDDSASSETPRKTDKKLERIETPSAELADLIRKYDPEYIALGNGPRVRQVERFVRSAVKSSGRKVPWVTVPEAGSWILATSRPARKELPDSEPAVRAAVCLARRLQDPLAEMSKLDPRVLGIGQGHHEVDQKSLRDALRRQASACACEVGIDLNQAPAELLELAPGMTDRVARRIVEHRGKSGALPNLAAAEKMPGVNRRVWQQASGFFRILDGDNPLDATGVHPDLYEKALELMAAANVEPSSDVADAWEKLRVLDLAPFADQKHPTAMLQSIIREFDPQRRNPRGTFRASRPSSELEPISEPKSGMKVPGLVTNSASFGVFVDVGAEQDGLLHISQLPDEMVLNDRPKVKPGARLTVYITHFDPKSGKLSLSLREPRESSRVRRTSPTARRSREGGRPNRDRNGDGFQRRERAPVSRTFGPDRDEQARARAQVENMSLSEKLAALGDKFRTKV